MGRYHMNHFSKKFILQTDASDRGVGLFSARLEAMKKNIQLHSFSRKLLSRETRYATVEKEYLAILLGIQAFKAYLAGVHFIIQTDHRVYLIPYNPSLS